MADYTGTILPAISDPISQDLNGEYDGNKIILTSQLEIYRGKVGGVYVYSVGGAPDGATDIVIIGYT